MGRLLKTLTVLLFITSCGQVQHDATSEHMHRASSLLARSIASTVVSTPTTLQRASRSADTPRYTAPKVKQAQPKTSPSYTMPDDFWWRLSHNCECSGGSGCAGSGGWFQFKGSTAEAVGYFVGATYDQQLAMAKWWLVQIKGAGGSTAGWPVCWWNSLRA